VFFFFEGTHIENAITIIYSSFQRCQILGERSICVIAGGASTLAIHEPQKTTAQRKEGDRATWNKKRRTGHQDIG